MTYCSQGSIKAKKKDFHDLKHRTSCNLTLLTYGKQDMIIVKSHCMDYIGLRPSIPAQPHPQYIFMGDAPSLEPDMFSLELESVAHVGLSRRKMLQVLVVLDTK
jgi:hypothetical protein